PPPPHPPPPFPTRRSSDLGRITFPSFLGFRQTNPQTLDESIERECSGAATEQDQQHCGPLNVCRAKPADRQRFRSQRSCPAGPRSEEHTSELQSPDHLVCR